MLQTSRSYGAKIIFQYSMLHTFRGYGVEIIFQYSMLQTYCPYGAIINFIAYCLLPIALCAMLYALCYFPWHCLYFFPLPHGQGSFLPTLGSSRLTVSTIVSGRRPAAAAAFLLAASSTRFVLILLKSVFCSLASRTSSLPCIIKCPRDK